MLDINLIRQKPEWVEEKLRAKGNNASMSELLAMDESRRKIIASVEEMKAERNRVSKTIPMIKKQGGDISAVTEEMRKLGDEIKALDDELNTLNAKIKAFMDALPNLPADDVVPGGKEANQVVNVWGEQPTFDFTPKDHVELATSLNLIDYERGAKLGGNGFWIYKGKGAMLEWALINYFIDTHISDGYEFILPPHILSYQCGYTAGQFPKFEDDVFVLQNENGEKFNQFILPTAETALINYHRDEILSEDELPKKYFAYTPCYRKEAGSYRSDERGMVRGHQFNKVEMFQYTTPETSDAALMELIGKAERLMQGLGLHYRLSKLAAQDCSDSMAKTYDIEVWIPSMGIYKEVSSSSNAMDYQARRGNIRFRRNETKKIEFVHSLNASGLATSRIMPALLEQCQQADGSVVVPEVLRKYMGGISVLK
ncbi:MAG: serine--tRNA ligase [Clostridiales bacterium]|nr:serine--tRNA ligase [Clostridiales bacterium]